MSGVSRLVLSALMGVLPIARPAAAQQDQRLDRLAPETRALVAPIVDSARAQRLPVEPLVERALEGTSKHAAPELIAQVVRRLAGNLANARQALGLDATPEAVVAGADALHAGATAALLQRISQSLGSRPMAVPLAVLADLTARGVPADTAAALTLERSRSTSDADLLALERDVERDIALGAAPLAATADRFNTNTPTASELSGPGTGQPSPPKPHKP